MKRIILLFTIILLSNITIINAKEITNEDIYRELKVFQARAEERFISIDNRFEQIDKRFEQIDKQFGYFVNIMIGVIAAFAAIVAVSISFAVWDRKTTITESVNKSVEKIENSGTYHRLLSALRERAKSDKKLAQVLHRFNLL